MSIVSVYYGLEQNEMKSIQKRHIKCAEVHYFYFIIKIIQYE